MIKIYLKLDIAGYHILSTIENLFWFSAKIEHQICQQLFPHAIKNWKITLRKKKRKKKKKKDIAKSTKQNHKIDCESIIEIFQTKKKFKKEIMLILEIKIYQTQIGKKRIYAKLLL